MNKKEKHIFTDSYNERKARLLSHLEEKEETNERGTNFRRTRSAMLIAAVLAAVLAVSVGAAVALSRMNMTKEGGKTTVTASLGSGDTEEKPLRSWNPTGDEVAVRLDFAYLPDDMTEDETAPYKFGSTENGRWMTLYGYDLRQQEMNSIITDTTEVEEFSAGGHQAYVVRTSETHSDNELYIMFEEDDLVVGGYVGKGITDEELKKIVEGMTLSETTDVYTAMPIYEKDDGRVEWSFPVFRTEDVLKSVGDTVKDADGRFKMSVEKINVLDSFEGIDMADCRTDQLKPFVDVNGSMIEYQRTEVIWEDGVEAISHFGDTKTVKKCLVTADFTYTNTTGEKDGVWVLDSRVFGDGKDYRIDETRKLAHFSEPIYVSGSSKTGVDSPYIREIDAGETIKFTLGWLVDEDLLDETDIKIYAGSADVVAEYDISKETKYSTALPIYPDDGVLLNEKYYAYPTDYLTAGEVFRNIRDGYTLSVDSVSVAYDVKALDPEDCKMDVINEFTDGQGNFIEYDRAEVVYGNGEDKISHYGERSKSKKMLVTADFTYTNTGKEKDKIYAFDTSLQYIGSKTYYRVDNEYAPRIGYYGYLNTPVYISCMSESGAEDLFDILVDAGETVTFTLGWLIDEDLFESGAAIVVHGCRNTTIAYYNLVSFDIEK